MPDVDRTERNGIPVTTPARTLIDVAAVSPPLAVEEALDDALRRKLVSIPRLRWRLEELNARGRSGITVIRRLLDVRDGLGRVPESVFETRLLRAMHAAGLRPVLQHEVRARGRLVAIIDFAFPDVKVAIEADGFRWHSGRARWDIDRARRNELTLLGWRIIHVTWTEFARDPESVIDSIRRALVDVAPPTADIAAVVPSDYRSDR